MNATVRPFCKRAWFVHRAALVAPQSALYVGYALIEGVSSLDLGRRFAARPFFIPGAVHLLPLREKVAAEQPDEGARAICVGWAKRSVPTRSPPAPAASRVGTAPPRHCTPYNSAPAAF